MHTIKDARNDINKIAQYLREKDVIVETAGRTSPHFTHPIEKGWERLSNSDWLPSVLASSLVEEEEVQRGEVQYLWITNYLISKQITYTFISCLIIVVYVNIITACSITIINKM